MKFLFQNKEMLAKIENLAAKFLVQFSNELELTKDDQGYYDLIMASVVFKEIILNNFKTLMADEPIDDLERLIVEWEAAGKQIADQLRDCSPSPNQLRDCSSNSNQLRDSSPKQEHENGPMKKSAPKSKKSPSHLN